MNCMLVSQNLLFLILVEMNFRIRASLIFPLTFPQWRCTTYFVYGERFHLDLSFILEVLITNEDPLIRAWCRFFKSLSIVFPDHQPLFRSGSNSSHSALLLSSLLVSKYRRSLAFEVTTSRLECSSSSS